MIFAECGKAGSCGAFADVGDFGGDSDMVWQMFASLGYQPDARWSFQGGWRCYYPAASAAVTACVQ